MKLVIQRVKQAAVRVADEVVGQIRQGMLVFVGIGKEDTQEDADKLIQKIMELRIFEDEEGKMNLSTNDVQAEVLIVSQFTLYGDLSKGRRPSFDKAADPDKAKELYEYFVDKAREENVRVETGLFGAMMDVSLVNDGPVTFILESK